jgi:hypothetical protein
VSRPAIQIRAERGFALVGVIMFLLVLTILGLSLFSLTGYESQFMQQSMDGAEAFHAAAGGLDRARFALAMKSDLEIVKQGLPLDGVIYAVARRDVGGGIDSTSDIDWDNPTGEPILIRVKAQKNGKTHMIEGLYSPSRAQSLYQRLMSLSGAGANDSVGLAVIRKELAEVDENPYWATWLYGEARQNQSVDLPQVIFPFGFPEQSQTLAVTPGGVPAPDVDGFLAAHWTGATEARSVGQNRYNLSALDSPDSVRFYRTTRLSGNWSFDFILSSEQQMKRWDPQVNVSGTVIWMFDKGIRSEGTIHVSGSGSRSDLLVLVAKPGNDPGIYSPYNPSAPDAYAYNAHRSLRGAGIALLGSIRSTIPVILVSDGGVLLENRDFGYGEYDGDDKTSTSVQCLSVFAKYARVLGPDSDMGTNPNQNGPSGARTTLVRNATDPIDARIDRLSDLGLLPNTAGALKGKLRFLAGSWREVTETNPP